MFNIGDKAEFLTEVKQHNESYYAFKITDPAGVQSVYSTTTNGYYHLYPIQSPNDILNTPPPKIKKKVWVNIYPDGWPCFATSRNKADKNAYKTRIACKEIEIEYYEGEGL